MWRAAPNSERTIFHWLQLINFLGACAVPTMIVLCSGESKGIESSAFMPYFMTTSQHSIGGRMWLVVVDRSDHPHHHASHYTPPLSALGTSTLVHDDDDDDDDDCIQRARHPCESMHDGDIYVPVLA